MFPYRSHRMVSMTSEIPYIPGSMSTQHPDNVNTPFFAESSELGGEDEVQEAYYVFSHLGCREQMWDCEGKEVDNFVVKKLLSKYDHYFRDHQLGRDRFLTLRVPNPEIEKTEAKILLETLASIPRSYDVAQHFYRNDFPPVFEVILPMTSSYVAIDNIYQYYRDFVIGQQYKRLGGRDLTIADWIGKFCPDHINVIPLFEDQESMLHADAIVERYLQEKDVAYQRVFLARSDPAMNYGLIAAVLFNKIALYRIARFSRERGIPVFPIIGVGGTPFRGNLTPGTVDRVMQEYPSVRTVSIQSAFKYDYPFEEVRDAVGRLEKKIPGSPHPIEEADYREIIGKYIREYQASVATLSPVINRLAAFVPSRRKRKLHIGLFGYARNTGGLLLPRAITFTSALYSLGLPPEFLGLTALDRDDFLLLKKVYVNLEEDLRDALRYFDPESGFVPPGLGKTVQDLLGEGRPDEDHIGSTRRIAHALRHDETFGIREEIIRAATLRHALG